MSESILRDQSKQFAKAIVLLVHEIRQTNHEYVLTDQLVRSGTSIGANIHEAQYAQGRADFIAKLEISLKECFETEYWLELLHDTGYLPTMQYKDILSSCGKLRRMLISSCKTVKEK